MKRLIVLLLLISAVWTFDFIRESFKYVNIDDDPCENFYRHACPIRPGLGHLFKHEYEDLIFKLKSENADAVWNNLEIEETFKRTHFKEILSPIHYIENLYLQKCEDENVSRQDLESYLYQITYYLLPKEDFSALTSDPNCTRATGTLRNLLRKEAMFLETPGYIEGKGLLTFHIVKTGLNGINAVLDGDAREGVTIVHDIVESMKTKVTSWINQTSWAVNNEAQDAIIAKALQVYHFDNYADELRNSFNYLFKIEQDYLMCARDTSSYEEDRVFCMIMALAAAEAPPREHFFTVFNAMNDHPDLYFSYLLYDVAKNSKEWAGVLGSVGHIVGHEISHTLIEDPNKPKHLPYSSNETIQCIQNQYQKTCDSFKEVSCGALDNQIDENGSDMLGMHLAYSLFKDAYKYRMRDEYIRIASHTPGSYQSITMEQLFFYSTAFSGCIGDPLRQWPSDPHSPYNIRINAIAQHPGFRQAFNCGSDSKMVQSFNDQCIIFGEGAPESRR